MLPGWIEYALTRIESLSTSRQIPTMTLPIALSAAARRTHPSSISHLMQTALENPGIVSLAAGFVDQQSLPVELVGHAIGEVFSEAGSGRRALQYGTTVGDLRLRSRVLEYLERSDGGPAGCYKEALPRTIVTNGSAQLIYLVCEALLDPGDIVLVESPTYFVFLGPIETRGARAIRIPIDEGGMRIDDLEQTLERLEFEGQLDRVKLIYTIPEHANPTGVSLAAITTAAAARGGTKMVEKTTDLCAGGCCLPRAWVRRQGAAVDHESRRRRRHGHSGGDVQQDAQPGAQDRIRGLARSACGAGRFLEREPRFRLGELKPATARADDRRTEATNVIFAD